MMILIDYINQKWHYNTGYITDYLVELESMIKLKKSVLFSVPFIILLPHEMNRARLRSSRSTEV
jgi:hypothetical protein